MRYLSKIAAVTVMAAVGLGLTACDEGQSLPALDLVAVFVGQTGEPTSWPQSGLTSPLIVVANGSTPFKGSCTLRIPASPISSSNSRTQVLIPLTMNVGFGYGEYPAGVNPELVPPGTYDADVNCSGNRRSSLVQVTLLGTTNVLQSITSSQNFVATMDQVLTVTATNMGNGCELRFAGPAPVSADPAVLTLPVTSSPAVNGVVTTGTAQYVSSQTTLETHTNWASTLVCPDRENSGTVTVNFH